jgi:hypothetical protein
MPLLSDLYTSQTMDFFTIFEFLTAVNISMLIFWIVMSCALIRGYQRFEGIYCLHLQAHSVTTQKSDIVMNFIVYVKRPNLYCAISLMHVAVD